MAFGDGPFHFRFEHPVLQELLATPPTTPYLIAREGGLALQVLHLRTRAVTPEVFGPQRFFVENAAGARVGQGVLLVAGRAPEGVDLFAEDGSRVFEVNRPSSVRLLLRPHGNYGGEVQLLNTRDWGLRILREHGDSAGVLVLAAELRPLRAEAKEVRLGVETQDGRLAEVVFPGVSVRPATPRRVRVSGGPVYLDASGRGSARIQLRDIDTGGAAAPEIVTEATGELSVLEQRWDRGAATLDAHVEFVARAPRQPGTREVRDLQVRSGAGIFRGFVEVVAAPVVASVRTEGYSRALLAIGGGVSLLRVGGQNLDALRLDCAVLGAEAECRTVSVSPTELVAEIGLPGLRLVFDEAEIPAEHGWQKLVVTVRRGAAAGELPLLDASSDPRHGDLFLVRVEHAAEQYAPEHRAAVASADARVHRIYVDGGAAKRLTGDIAVQPVLFGLGGADDGSAVDVLYPNAGFGVTWQGLDERLEPRLFSTKLQFLMTNLQAVKGGGRAGGRPALFLSGNLRIPGADPNRPLTLTTGVARMLGEDGGWRMLAGAGMDLGVARMIFGQ